MALVLTACGESPLAPENAVPSIAASIVADSTQPSLSVAGGAIVGRYNFVIDLDLITANVLPHFADAAAGKQLALYIADIKTAVGAGNKTEVARLLVLAREITAKPSVANEIDLGYIAQILSAIESAIQ